MSEATSRTPIASPQQGNRKRGRRGGGSLLAALLIAPAFLFFLAFQSEDRAVAAGGPAHFVLEYCDPAVPQTSDPFLVFSVSPPQGVPLHWFNDCLKPGGSLGIQEVGNSGDASATLSVSIPRTPGGYVESESMIGGTAALGAANTNVYVYAPGWPFRNGGEDLRVFRIRNSPSVTDRADGNFTIGWNCVGPLNSCGAGPIVYARDISVTEVDPNPPAISIGGELLSGHAKRGHQALAASATDLGGGLSRIDVLVNGVPASPATLGTCNTVRIANPGYEGVAAVSPSPCPSRLGASWQLNTAAYPFSDGLNTVEVCASDFATFGDPNTSCSPPQSVAVDNSCAASAAAGGELLSARFATSGSSKVVVPYGRGAEVIGNLSDASGEPIPGATICVQAAVQGSSAGRQAVATTGTDSAGNFSYEVQPGPNRQLMLGYRHDSFQVAQTIGFHSHTHPSISIKPKRVKPGGRIRIKGALPFPRARGRIVILQAAALRGRWLTFRRATTDRRGHFTARYRFGASRGVTYRIRAVVPRQHGYPYNAGHSRAARVRVTR